MWLDLRTEIVKTFAALEGCGLPTSRDIDGESRAFGFGVWDPEKEAEGKREFQREYEKRPKRRAALALWRKNNKAKILASERTRRAARKKAA